MVRPGNNFGRVLGLIEEVAATGNPVTAINHLDVQKFQVSSRSDMFPHAVVAHRREFARETPSGATRVITVEHLTDIGSIILAKLNRHKIGSVHISLLNSRPMDFYGRHQVEQTTRLGLGYLQNGLSYIALGPTAEFPILDETMVEETSREWEKWGAGLIYNSDVDDLGYFADLRNGDVGISSTRSLENLLSGTYFE